ncbi:rRNA methyltransferase [Pseudonocardia spirodelae]|uniref:rRNA methyltransferase n=1 Tax=Pseudonocardia spirodelae TaxID=3133431 RepID=A0ABU8T6L8_9PSEU
MQYRHAPAANHAALDAVLASAPGRPTLPVRLTVELAGRGREHLGRTGALTVWDPCCGAGVTPAVLGLLVPGLARLTGTDADPAPLGLARRNLGLLDPGGLADRAAELDALAARHGKPGYAGAAAAARTLVPASTPSWTVAVADARDTAAVRTALGDAEPDLVLADLPHGRATTWADAPGAGADPAPEHGFLRGVAAVLRPGAVVVAVGRGRTVGLPPGVRPLERLRAGHRAAVLVRAGALQDR